MVDPAHIQQLFDIYRSVYPEEISDFPLLSEQLEDFEGDICSRKNFRGHVIADGCVIDPRAKKVLQIYHATFKRWFTPGGHIDDIDAHPASAALREVLEETGITPTTVLDENKEPLLLHIDTHAISAHEGKQEPKHFHHAMTFLFLADATISLPMIHDDGVLASAWVDMAEAAAHNERMKHILSKIELF